MEEKSLLLSTALDFKCQRRSAPSKKVLYQNPHGHGEQRMEVRGRKGVLDSRPIFPTYLIEWLAKQFSSLSLLLLLESEKIMNNVWFDNGGGGY